MTVDYGDGQSDWDSLYNIVQGVCKDGIIENALKFRSRTIQDLFKELASLPYRIERKGQISDCSGWSDVCRP